jgi:ribonuclease HI
VKITWIKGHNQHPQNERCDKLAVAASKQQNNKQDTGYITNRI